MAVSFIIFCICTKKSFSGVKNGDEGVKFDFLFEFHEENF